jgi:RNA polymerase sigma-70 factor (ECF subfamily)
MTHGLPNLPLRAPRIGALDEAILSHLGRELRGLYGNPGQDRLPRDLARLLRRVAQVIRAHTEPLDPAFRDGIVNSIPVLRAFAISLTRNVDQAEDLVQDTVLKALSKQESFEPGTNLQAWLLTILRNAFLTAYRRSRREVADEDGSHAAKLICVPDQEDRIVMQELGAALARLPAEQRDAVLLVGAEGLPYAEAAQALGCALGTLKSRVNRARNRLAELMGLSGADGIATDRSIRP